MRFDTFVNKKVVLTTIYDQTYTGNLFVSGGGYYLLSCDNYSIMLKDGHIKEVCLSK